MARRREQRESGDVVEGIVDDVGREVDIRRVEGRGSASSEACCLSPRNGEPYCRFTS